MHYKLNEFYLIAIPNEITIVRPRLGNLKNSKYLGEKVRTTYSTALQAIF